MNFIKKLFVVCVGIIIAFIFCEVLLRIFGYSPQQQIVIHQGYSNIQDFINWAYLDIREPFFKISNNNFKIQRKDYYIPIQDNNVYKLKKDEGKKRIFIVGESVAKYFDKNILEKDLEEFFDVEIINVGMGGYDSYRIEKITKEIKSLNPDWVIFCIGNNDGSDDVFYFNHFNPLDINILALKYSVFKKIYTLNLISNFLYPSVVLNKDNVEQNFQKNILKIIKNLKNTNIVFCDLPNNEYFRTGNLFNSIIERQTKESVYWKQTHNFEIANKYKNVYITNFVDILKKYSNDILGYNFFTDNCHLNKEAYMLLSKLITEIIVKKIDNKEINVIPTKDEFNEKIKQVIDIPRCANDPTGYMVAFDRLENILNNNTIDSELKNIYVELKKDIENKTNYMTLVCYADVLQEQNRIKESKELLNKLISLAPNNFEAYLIMGYIEYKNNNFEKADKYFAKVKELNKDSNIDVAYLNSLK